MSNTASTIKANSEASGSFYRLRVGRKVGIAPLLEQKIAVLAEGNADKQTEIAANGGVLTPISSSEVAEVAGYGSPAHLTAVMMFDNLNPDVTIKYFFVPENASATKTGFSLAGTGTAVTKTGTLVLNVNGDLITLTLAKDQTLAEALATIKDAINADINLPCDVSTATPVADIDIESKWQGQSSTGLTITEYSNTSEGLTFALTKTDGTGETIPTTELAKLTNDWFPHVLNCLGNGIANGILDAFEDFNGSSSAGNGKYSAENMTPFVAWTATHESVLANITAVTDSRKNFNTNVYVPFTNAQDFEFQNAAEAVSMFVARSSNDPKQDIKDDAVSFATPPEDGDVGSIMDYEFRDALVKAGSATVNYKDSAYYTADMITTYRPDGETDPVLKYVRDNMIIFNLINQIKSFNDSQKNKTIAPNALPSPYITSAKLYKAGIINEIIKPFVELGYLADLDYAKENIDVGINPTNAGRFDIVTPNLITSLLRIVATDVVAGKYYGE